MTRRVSLLANDQPVDLDYFVEGFIDLTTGGMVAALKDTDEIKTLEVTIEGDKVNINLNDTAVPINDFVSQIFKSTIEGMVSSLKGVDEISKLRINIIR